MKKYLDNSVPVPELGRLVGEGRVVTVMVRGNSMLPWTRCCDVKALLAGRLSVYNREPLAGKVPGYSAFFYCL